MELKPLIIMIILLSGIQPVHPADMVGDIRHLSEDIGPRPAGSAREMMAAEYLASRFRALGIDTEVEEFGYYSLTSPGVRRSCNVIATIEGDSEDEIILCADLDTPMDPVSGNYSAGASDDATGLALLLEIAERYHDRRPPYTIKLIAFGAGEDGFTFPLVTPKRTSLSPDAYHQIVYLPYLVGARHYILNRQDDVDRIIAVISLEAMGTGTPCVVRRDYYSDNSGPLVDLIALNARLHGIRACVVDFMAASTPSGEQPISHVYLPFSVAGVPSTFLVSMRDPSSGGVHSTITEMPGYLSDRDTYSNLVEESGGVEGLKGHMDVMADMVECSVEAIFLVNRVKDLFLLY